MPTALRFDTRPVRVLLIDDDEEDFLLTRARLANLPGGEYHLDWVSDYAGGLEAVSRGDHDVYLLDYRLGPRSGLELLQELQRRGVTAPIILLTGQGEYATDRAAMLAGAADYLEKAGLNSVLLERSIRYALLQKRYQAELERQVAERTRELEQVNHDLRREVAERAKAEEALREADRRKDEFIATLAHELRNPLAPITNALEIMRLSGDNPEAVERARAMMERQIKQMVRLIDDLLDVSRVTRGKLQLVMEPIDLRAVVETALEISKPQIERAQLTFQSSIPAQELRVHGDRVRLAQVLSNLLNNAAKFTEPGGKVLLAVERVDSQAVVRVRDTGVGIPPDALPRVFNLFTQINPSQKRAQGGLGIGLALVRKLVELHGGTVVAHSDGPGRGAEFTVTLPVNES
jgi:signal transduction histidine kinase